MVNSNYWTDVDEVAAFEELVGSHGGMGGTQSFPFVLHPRELELPAEEVVGPEALHRHFRRWLVELGHDEYGPVPEERRAASAQQPDHALRDQSHADPA
jgi:hypothetical protein